ncbi:MAG: ABC transporter ATP-binding protein [Dehalococcoidales bacterium]|nr:MAG: ABC transporter ATP-binding protein [Dehalococcoidales bacterium]
MSDKEPHSSQWAIEARGLAKLFGNKYALKDIDLGIRQGERLVIFGPNGAGKTTLVRLLSTLAKPSAGSVHIDGLDTHRNQALVRRKVGVVGHQTYLYGNLTVHENLKFYGRMYGVPDLERRIQNVAGQVQLESRLHDRVSTLSRGLQQRAAIARAVIHEPQIMLLDEPEVGLDPQAVIMMRDVLDIFSSGERTVVMTTHNLERGLDLCEQVIILNTGKIVYQAGKSEIDRANFPELYSRYTGVSQ